jgi:hypothetical protein
LLFGFAAVIQTAAWAQANDPMDLLLRVRDNVTKTVARLPKYLCSLTIERAQYSPNLAHALSCDGLAGQRTKVQFKPRLAETDRVRLDVAIAAGNEIYSWIGEERFDDRDVFDLVREGALQTGGFSSFLTSIFGGTAASFSYNGEREVNGRTLAEFGFQVPIEQSNYVFGNRRAHVITGYDGAFLADPNTGDLVRLRVRTSGLPTDSGACEATTTLDYNRMRLNDSEFLLPREANLEILSTDGSEMRNRTVYSSCHEFQGESAVRFDEPSPEPAAVNKAPPARASALALPAGIVFRLLFTQPIETATASAGDRIKAKLYSPIRDPSSKAVLVPKDAEVTARVMRLEHFPGPPSSVRMLVKLETVNVGGTPVPFRATKNPVPEDLVDVTNKETGVDGKPVPKPSMLDTSVSGSAKVKLQSGEVQGPPTRVLQRRIDLGSLDPLADPTVGVFEFRDVNTNFVVKSGLESDWMTVAAQ